ncbi:MAG TPA: SBBP repeat-containing protein [Thermoanaerobaculia bacterium]|nr:SBBP repeat-containing protein [Thermoanaerobaculia bacterium]
MRRRGLIAAAALISSAAVNLLVARDVDTSRPHAAAAKLDAVFGKLPLSFEPNRGQFDARVRFVARGPGYSVFLTPAESVLDLRRAVVRMRLAGANKNPSIAGAEQLPGRSNYYQTDLTRARAACRAGVCGLLEGATGRRFENIPSYASVRYANVYSGVDLIYRGNQQQLEYDLVVAPGADPGVIRLAFEGVERMKVSTEGELVLQVAGGEIRQHKPILYQEVDGVRKSVDGSYVIAGSRQVRFSVGAYDRGRPLILDPVVSWGTYMGGSASDFATAIAIDTSGNTYITGQTQSTDFPLLLNPPDPNPILSGHYVLFVAKINAAGTTLMYSTYWEENPAVISYNVGKGIKVDAANNAYITGQYGPGSAALILRLNASGIGTYAVSLGTSGDNRGNGIAIDGAGYAYVTGLASSTGFPITMGAYQTTSGGGADAFIAKLNTNGASNNTSIVYSTYLGGSTDDEGNAIAIDGSGKAYVTGQTFGSSFPVTAGAFQSTAGGGLSDAFVSKLSADGTTLLYSTLLGGGYFEAGYAIAVDASGYASIAGYAESSGLPTTAGAYQTTWTYGDCRVLVGDPPKPCGDAFVAKFNPSASGAASLVYSTYLGSSGRDIAYALAIDGAGNAYVSGLAQGAPYTPPGPFPAVNPIAGFNSSNSQGFVARLNAAGSALLFSTYYTSEPDGLVLDGSGGVYIAGGTTSTTGIATGGAYQTTNHGSGDAYIAKLSGFPVPPTITSHPQSQTIAFGQMATMSVSATGPGPISYQWYVGASGTTSNPIGGATSSSYTTPALTNTTRYWVRVSNAADSADSYTATISVSFTDDPLTSGVSMVRVVHITELRARVAGLRARYGLPVFMWSYPTLTAGVTPVRAPDILDLRTALGDVYVAASRTAPSYTDPGLAIGTTI